MTSAPPLPQLRRPPRPRSSLQERTGAPELLVIAVVLTSMLDHYVVAKLALRALPLWAVVLVLAEPAETRTRRVVPLSLVLFTAWAASSWLWSVDQPTSERRVIDLAIVVVVAWAAAARLDLDRLRDAIAVALKVLVVASFVALVVAPGWATAPNVDGAPGWHAVFSHKNGLGAAAVIAALTFWMERRGPGRVIWTGGAVVLVIGSQSATALALLLLLVAVASWRRALAALREPTARVGYLVLSAVFGTFALWVSFARFDDVTALFGRGSGLTGRTDIWAATWSAVLERPLQGYGYGAVWEQAIPPTSTIWREIRFVAYHAHSGYLDVLVQLGAVGLVLLAVVLTSTAARAWASRQRGRQQGRRRGGQRGNTWAVMLVGLLAVNAVVESGPVFGAGFALLALLATSTAQDRSVPAARAGPAAAADDRAPSRRA